MRLLFVSHSLPPIGRPLDSLGGMQRVALELDAALKDRQDIEYDTRFLRASWSTVHFRAVPFLFGTLAALRRQARNGELEVVLFSSMVTAALAVLLTPVFRKHGVLAAAIVHGRDVTVPRAAYQWFVPRVFRALDLVMPVSAATGEECVSRGLDPEKLRPVRNGVDVARFAKPEFEAEQRRQVFSAGMAPSPDCNLLLCSVGRQVRRKGFEWFIRHVMPQLPGSVHYWLAGDGPENSSIRAAIEDCGMENRVRMLGRVDEDDLSALYLGADVFVMPNIPVPGDMEGFGVVMLEAGLSGLPTVGSRLEGIAEVIKDGENGHLVQPGDAGAFVEAISALVRDQQYLEQASERAYDYTRSSFSWPTVAADYLSVMRSYLDRDRRTGPTMASAPGQAATRSSVFSPPERSSR